MYTIALLCHWTTGKELAKVWNHKFSDESHRVKFWDLLEDSVKRKTPPDYWVIINAPVLFEPMIHPFIPARTVVFEMEPIRFWKELDQYEHLFLKVYSHHTEYNNVEWHLDMTMKEVEIPIVKDEEKAERISAVLSEKYFDPGHIKRIQFAKYIENRIHLDVYGKNAFEYKNYCGTLPPSDKNLGMFPYRYHFTAENHSKRNYFTEKITDAILSECLCFYWGCPNLSDYIDPRAYIVLDLDDFEGSAQKVEEAIQNQEWEKRIDIIRREKHKLMRDMNFLRRLERLFDSIE